MGLGGVDAGGGRVFLLIVGRPSFREGFRVSGFTFQSGEGLRLYVLGARCS